MIVNFPGSKKRRIEEKYLFDLSQVRESNDYTRGREGVNESGGAPLYITHKGITRRRGKSTNYEMK